MYHSDGKGQNFKQKGWLSQMSTPLLSIGMIVKDEIRCIERCFKSLEGLRRDLPCELVIADTGSTDGTREIVEKYADVVFDFEWCNDFSAARNAVLNRCTGKWHLQLDADEWLSADYQELIDFCHSPQFKTYHTASIRIQNHYGQTEDSNYSEFTTERLFRISSGFRFVGQIHESPKPPIDFKESYKNLILGKVFLHHDGYIQSIKQEKQKNKRNLDILKPLLEKDPDNLKLLCQCIESAETPDKQISHVEHGMELLHEGKGNNTQFAPSLIRYAIVFYAMKKQIENMEGVWEFCKEKYSQFPYISESPYIELDGNAAMVLAYYAEQNYKKAVEIGLNWYRAERAYEDNKQAHLSLVLGTLVVNAKEVYTALFESLCLTERWKEAEDILYHVAVSRVTLQRLGSFINIFIDHAIHFKNPLKALHWVIEEQEENFKEKIYLSWNDYRSILLAKIEEHVRKKGELWPIIAELQNDVGYCAKALLQENDQEMLKWADHIENWGNVMSLIYVRILDRNLLFPSKFYQQNAEIWGSVAGALVKLPGLTELFLSYEQNVPAITIEQKYWYSSLASALLAAKKWDSQTQAVTLCRCFAHVEQELVAQMYLPQMLTDASIHLMPTGHRFSWYLKQAFEAIQTGNLKESIAILRKALESAPVYNAAMDALLDYVSTLNSSPELLALAEKIRGILAQYNPDDPAVQAIKESPAYQKVAYLIDGVNPPVVGGLLQ